MTHDYTDEEIGKAWDCADSLQNYLVGLRAFLDALRQSTQLAQTILSDDGRSLGQVAMKASFDADTDGLTVDECYEAAAQAVAAVVLAQAVRRMESVPQEEIWKVYKDDPHPFAQKALESVRARLIAAAKGEAQPVVVNQPPQDEKQPDLSGESERQAEAQPWTPAVGDTVRLKSGGPVMTVHYVANDGLSHCVCSINGAAFNFSTIPAACLTPAQP